MRRASDERGAAHRSPAAIVRAFGRALELRDIEALALLLAPEVRLAIDGGGAAITAGPVSGSGEALPLLLRMLAARPRCTVAEHAVNGGPGLVLRDDGLVVTVIGVDVDRGRASGIWVVTSPAKLAHWNG